MVGAVLPTNEEDGVELCDVSELTSELRREKSARCLRRRPRASIRWSLGRVRRLVSVAQPRRALDLPIVLRMMREASFELRLFRPEVLLWM